MTDCIFCKIIAGDIPCTKVYEDDHVFAFLDIAPITKGHLLVIPKKHSINLYDIPSADLHHCIDLCQKLAISAKKALLCDGVNLGMNNEAPAGQAVFHAHFHLIPRYSGDGLHHWPGHPDSEDVTDELAKTIRKNL